jgi:hypothetical protein
MITPVINAAIRIVTAGLKKKTFEAIRGKHSIDLVQEPAELGTSHIILKVLQSEI